MFMARILQGMSGFKKDDNNKESPQEILRRIEKQSSAAKLQETMNILNRKETQVPNVGKWWSKILQNMTQTYQNSVMKFNKVANVKENKHMAVVTIFFIGSLWISWQVEEKYDQLRRKAKTTKSYKERQIESENSKIQKMLARNPFQPVPIEQQQAQEYAYLFQKADIEFDTRADLEQVLQEERQMFGSDDQ